MQVLFETTVMGVSLDLQTYLKVLLALYYETPGLSKESQILTDSEKKQTLNLIYLFFKTDCGEADFQFGCELLYEYINAETNNPAEFTEQEISESKKKKKKRHQQQHQTDSTNDLLNQPWGSDQ
jgi:hypothetical protein